jgi:hypothetical protein
MTKRFRHTSLIVIVFLVLVACLALPAQAHAASGKGLPIPWLDDIVAQLLAALVKVLQDLLKGIGVLLWSILKLCGLTGLLGSDFSSLFGNVVVEAINAVVGGTIAAVIRGSLMVSIALLGASLLVKIFWPDLKIVSFQRIVIWGTVIQAFLLNAPNIYTQLEAMRVDLAEEIAQAVASGAVPGCSGSTVEIILCMSGTNATEVQDPNLTDLPDTLPPYGGSETIHDLYDHCVYNPAYFYGDPQCDPDDPQDDPWQVLTYAQDALGSQTLSIILGLLILAYGVLQLALGLAAGMMFVLFPIAGIFAFYLPLESFATGVIRNYIGIFLKSVVLLTLAAVVIRLFTVASGSLIALAAVGLIDLLICGIMAKEALASLLSGVSFIGNSVSNLGASVGLGGGGGGGTSGYPSPESRLAASMIGGGPLGQALMGAPNPYLGSTGGGLLGAAGNRLGAVKGGAQAAISAAVGAGTGGLGFAIGAMAAAKGAGFGSLALGSQAASTLGGSQAGQGFTLGAAAGTLAHSLLKGTAPGTPTPPANAPAPTVRAGPPGAPPSAPPPAPGAATQPAPTRQLQSPATFRQALAAMTTPTHAASSPPPALAPLQALASGQPADLSAWTPNSAQQLQDTAARLAAAPPDVQQSAYDLIQAGQATAQQWQAAGQSPALADGTIDPQFVDDVTQAAPAAARALTVSQAKAGTPAGQQVRLAEMAALGAATQQTLPARQVQRGFAGAIKAMGQSGNFGTALQGQLGIGPQAALGSQASQAGQIAAQLQQNGLANDLGRQLAETVQDDLGRNPNLSAQQFRDRHLGRMAHWDRATGDPQKTDQAVESLIGLGALGSAATYSVPGLKQPGPRTTLASVRAAQTPVPQPTTPAPQPTTPASQPTTPAPQPATPAPQPTTPAPQPTTPAPQPATYDPDLYDRLRTWRSQEAGQLGKAAFHVFTDATLQRIAAAQPQTREDLLAVKGVGPKKLDQFGQSVLGITQRT